MPRTRAAVSGAPEFKPKEPTAALAEKQPVKEVVVSTTIPADTWVQWRMYCLTSRQSAQKLLREMIVKTLREAEKVG